jgi:hypothetical protein
MSAIVETGGRNEKSLGLFASQKEAAKTIMELK